MYRDELPVKQCVQQNVAHLNTKDELVVALSTWEHEPFIHESTANLLMEAMLHETGIRC